MTHALRLHCSQFWVDLRVRRFGERCWIASADTPDWPTLGMGETAKDAIWMALEEFRDVRAELVAGLDTTSCGAWRPRTTK